MNTPRVYTAISAITADLARSGIAKSHVNEDGQYAYRSIDDVMLRLAPLLAKHRLCMLPRVLERERLERRSTGNAVLVSVALRVAFDIVSARDGSSHTVEAYGEALDEGDKATSKAMSAAFKQAALQTFCVPIARSEDADATSHRLTSSSEQPDPDQGWDQWALDMQDMIRLCESEEALDHVQRTYRRLFHAASKRRPDIYEAIGTVMRTRREALRPKDPAAKSFDGEGVTRKPRNGKAQAEQVAAHG